MASAIFLRFASPMNLAFQLWPLTLPIEFSLRCFQAGAERHHLSPRAFLFVPIIAALRGAELLHR